MTSSPEPAPLPTPAEVAVLQQEINDKLFSSYMFTFFACIVAIPLSIRRKSYWPLAILGSAGSIADLAYGYNAAMPQRLILRDVALARDAAAAAAAARSPDSGEELK